MSRLWLTVVMKMADKRQEILGEAADIGAYYRANIDQFAEDYFHIELHLFQRILLIMMAEVTTFVLIAFRGIGKTYLSAIYACIRCILWPGSRVCIASGKRGQAILVLEKIMQELKTKSPELAAEIDTKGTQINGTNAIIVFKNTSVIKVVTAADSARGNRCNVLLLDEFRLIDKDTIDTVLRKFLNWRRTPDYADISKEERLREYAKEKPLTLYLSSAWFTTHWSYMKVMDTCRAMLDDRQKQFVCGFPYELGIAEGRLDPDTCAEEMLDSDFSEIKWGMEMCAEFYGSAEDAFFDSESISRIRKIDYPMLPLKISSKVNNAQLIQVPPKRNGEIRIVSVDVALMKTTKRVVNDASAILLNCMLPTRAGKYISNFYYAESSEGLRTDDQALIIRKLFDDFEADYLVLDTVGNGLGVYDAVAKDIVDSESGEIYPALSCYAGVGCSASEMADRCTSPDAPKVIWAIKATERFNSDCANMLRDGIRSGRIRMLKTEYEADELLTSIKGYSSLSEADKIRIKLPYINTDLMVDELIKLQYEDTRNGYIRVYERAGMRKDRYSSLSYNYYVARQIENKKNKGFASSSSLDDAFIIRPPKWGRMVNNVNGKQTEVGW